MKRILLAVLLLTLAFVPFAAAEKPALPTPVIPDGLGYNIHFTDARPGEMEMIADSGATIIRMDFGWAHTEKEKEKYDFSAFERLTDALEKHGMRPLYILDYSNKFYDEGLSPYTEEGRKAFGKWAATAAVHFKGRKILWEMYNEPNIGFWKPKPNPDDYIKLALEVGKTLREAAPDELYIGPATSQIDMDFLEKCFKAGLLEYWDAVSVHPYRHGKGPETVVAEYAKLRYMIDKYAPQRAPSAAERNSGVAPVKKHIPILSAEWGYSSIWEYSDETMQGKLLPRQWMTNLACDVPVSIWYDWHDDGTDPKEKEHHFGTVNFPYKKDQKPVYDPKPAYIAAKTFNETFKGFQYNKRIWTGDDEVFVFVFNRSPQRKQGTVRESLADASGSVKLAAWTTSKEPKTITIPSVPGKFAAVSYLGEKLPDLTADKDGLKLTVSDGPIYLTPINQQDEFWKKLADLESLPLVSMGSSIQLRSPKQDGGATLPESADRLAPFSVYIHGVDIQGVMIVQNTVLKASNPVRIGLPIPQKTELVFSVDNESGDMLPDEVITFKQCEGIVLAKTVHTLSLKQGEKEKIIRLPLKSTVNGEYKFAVWTSSCPDLFPLRTMRLNDDFTKYDTESLNKAWGIHPDGDKNVKSEQKIESTETGLVKITYKFDDGWKFVRLAPKNNELRKIEGKPKELGVRVEGDGSGNSVNLRFTDSTGQTFQVHGGRLTEKKSYFFTFPLDGVGAGHWGGKNDGKITYPIRFDSILIDGTRKACGPYSAEVSSMVLIYE